MGASAGRKSYRTDERSMANSVSVTKNQEMMITRARRSLKAYSQAIEVRDGVLGLDITDGDIISIVDYFVSYWPDVERSDYESELREWFIPLKDL